MARKPTPAPRRAETFEERTARINREIAATNQRTGATGKPMTAPRRAAPATPAPSPHGQSRTPGNVPRPAASPAEARDPRAIPMGTGSLGRARSAVLGRREQIDSAVDEKPKPATRPRAMAGGGKVAGKSCGHKRK